MAVEIAGIALAALSFGLEAAKTIQGLVENYVDAPKSVGHLKSQCLRTQEILKELKSNVDECHVSFHGLVEDFDRRLGHFTLKLSTFSLGTNDGNGGSGSGSGSDPSTQSALSRFRAVIKRHDLVDMRQSILEMNAALPVAILNVQL